MKISTLEKAVLGLTAAFLLVTCGYFLGVRSSAQPYRVDAEYLAAAETPAPPTPAAAIETGVGALVNINTATVEELQVLPGIGEKRALDIVLDRTVNGPFRIPEDLTRVKGIGEGTLVQIMELITV